MSKEKGNMKLEPELRFPGFREDWDVMQLHELGNLINGLTYSPKDVRDKGLLVLRSSNVRNGKIYLDDCVYVKTDIKGANQSEPNDILICVRNGSKRLIGKNALIPKGMPLSTHGAFMTVFRTKIPLFIFQLFQSESYRRQVKADLGATINSINGKNFIKYEFGIPPKPKEQQKIAATLTSLDNLIAPENEKLDALQAHKKGLLQQLFPAKGEKVPKLRFGEFSGEWEETTLSKLGDLINGLTYSPKDVREKGLLVLRSSNVQNGQIDLKDCVFVRPDTKGANLSLPDDILICVRNGSKRLIGKNAIIPKEMPLSTHGAFMTMFRAKLSKFVFQLFQTEAYNRQVKADLGATINSINGKNFLKYEFIVPKDPKEQLRIADCFSSLDDLIAVQSEKIQSLKEHKKGLMQQMFPIV